MAHPIESINSVLFYMLLVPVHMIFVMDPLLFIQELQKSSQYAPKIKMV